MFGTMIASVTSIFLTILVALQSVTGNLGWTIVVFTLLVRAALVPLTLPSLRAQQKIRDLQPEIKALKEKHGADKKAFQQAQMDLYKRYNVNPLSGCLPQIVQLVLLFFLYHALYQFIGQDTVDGVVINTQFFWLNLTTTDPLYIIPVVAAVSQLILSVMILPGGETADVIPNTSKKKKVKEANKKEEDMAEMAASMQKQMLFIMPIMTGFFAARFPAGLGLYWIVTTVASIVQQYAISGPGGLTTYAKRALVLLGRKGV